MDTGTRWLSRAGTFLYASRTRERPSVSITPTPQTGNPKPVDVALEERDKGGIGQGWVSLSGKVIGTRRRAGSFMVDLSTRTAFFLPETRLPPGRRNARSVAATNGRGDLVILPCVMDLAVPSGLQARYAVVRVGGRTQGTTRGIRATRRHPLATRPPSATR